MATEFATRPDIRLAPSEVDEILELANREDLNLTDALNRYLGEDLSIVQYRSLIPYYEFYDLESRLKACYSCGYPLDRHEPRVWLDGCGEICLACNEELEQIEHDATVAAEKKVAEKKAAEAKDKPDEDGSR